jgi:regulatory protein
MDLLASREHGRAELKRKLAARGFPPELVDPVLERLASERLLDEGRYAEAFVSGRARRGQGPVRIASELRQRGVDETHSGEALAVAEVDWAALARETRAAKFGPEAPADYREWARQARFLQYRGFTMEQIRAALGEAPG